MNDVIVLDSSSSSSSEDEGVTVPPLSAHTAQWRTGVYADAVRDALAMVSALENDAPSKTNKPTATTKTTPPSKRAHGSVRRVDRSFSSVASSPSTLPTRVKLASRKSAGEFRRSDIRMRPVAIVSTLPPQPRPSRDAPQEPSAANSSATHKPVEIVLLTSSSESESESEPSLLKSPSLPDVAIESEEDVLMRSRGIPDDHSAAKTQTTTTTTTTTTIKPTIAARQRKRLRRYDDQPPAKPLDPEPRQQHAQQPPLQEKPVSVARAMPTATLARPREQTIGSAQNKNDTKMKQKMATTRTTSDATERNKQLRELPRAPAQSTGTGPSAIDLVDSDDEFESSSAASVRRMALSSSESSDAEWPLPPARVVSTGTSSKMCRKSAPLAGTGFFRRGTEPQHATTAERAPSRASVRATAAPERSPTMRKSAPSSACSSRGMLSSGAVRKSEQKMKLKQRIPSTPSPSATHRVPKPKQKPKQQQVRVSAPHSSESEEEETPRKRSRRKLEPQFNADLIAFGDFQAQEVEFARIKAQKVALDLHSSAAETAGTRDVAMAMDLCSSSSSSSSGGEHRFDDDALCDSDGSVETADTKSVRSEPGRSGTPSPALSLQPPVRTISPQKLAHKVPSVDAKPHAQRQHQPQHHHHQQQQHHHQQQHWDKPIAPMPHCRAPWSGSHAPPNLLTSDGGRPYEKILHAPLSSFDPSGKLEGECAFVDTFGQSQHLASSYLLETTSQSGAVQQEAATLHVQRVLQNVLPVIRTCDTTRCDTVIQESRVAVRSHLAARAAHRQSLVEAAINKMSSRERAWCRGRGREGENATPSDVKISYCRGRSEDAHAREQQIGELAVVVPMPKMLTVGQSDTCIQVNRNIRVDDDPIVRFLPVPSESVDANDAPTAAEGGEGGPAAQSTPAAAPATKPSKQGEFGLAATAIDDEVAEYALRAVVARCGDSEHVFHALKTTAGLSQPYTDYSALKKQHDVRRVADRRLADATQLIKERSTDAGGEDDGAGDHIGGVSLLTSSTALKAAKHQSLLERLAPPPSHFDSHLVRWHRERKSESTGTTKRKSDAPCVASGVTPQLNVRRTDDYGSMLESYRDLFCRICYCYDCQEHGIEQPQPTRRVDPAYPRLKTQSQTAAGATRHYEQVDSESDCDSIESTESMERMDDDGTESDDESERDEATPVKRRSSRSITVHSSTATSNWRRQERQRRKARRRERQAHATATDVTEYVDFSHVDLLAKPIAQLLSNEGACSDSCWKLQKPAATTATTTTTTATTAVKKVDVSVGVFVQKLTRLVGMNPCVIAAMMQPLPCTVVHALLEDQRQRMRDQEDWQDDWSERGHRSKKDSRSHASRTSSNRELLKRSRAQRPVDHSENHAYEPCRHEGPCDSTACGCLRRDHMCEKACSCPRDCPNRFQGCRCSFGACRTVGCPCVAAGRECEPDLCTSCGAADLALTAFTTTDSDHAHDHTSVSGHGAHVHGHRHHSDPILHHQGQAVGPTITQSATCANVHLQRGAHRKIAIGESDVHGWGAFAVGPIRRGDFITEYPGELISQDEAERRGLVYDRKAMSYLFDLNEDAVVDAIRKGNKSRFINHGDGSSQANCAAKIVRVGAEHRITIWAKRDIKADEELFFDYGYKTGSAPDWSQVRLTASSGRRESDQ